jgi:hypothetical protein
MRPTGDTVFHTKGLRSDFLVTTSPNILAFADLALMTTRWNFFFQEGVTS